MNTPYFIQAICSGGTFICNQLSKMFEINVINRKQDKMAINEILLYGAENEEHMKQIGFNNLLCIHYVISHASKSVDVCVPSLISDTLARCLIKVQQKNIAKIRIIIHNSNNFQNLQLFAQNGIEVKIINPTVRLEHEFILIDAFNEVKDSIAVMGSLDYETCRVNCNRDATVLTTDPTVVAGLKREFDRVWTSSISDM